MIAKLLVCWLFLMLITGCAGMNSELEPTLTDADRKALESSSYPYESDLIYDTSLVLMGEFINENSDFPILVQVKPIDNITGGTELPFNVTDMVLTALSRMAGRNVVVLPYDPQFINNDFVTGGKAARLLPTYLIGGSITEFDKDIQGTTRDINLDFLIGGGRGETDIGIGELKTHKMSRLALDLHLISYKNHAIVPGVVTSNTVNVMEIERGKKFGFAIYGSGLGINGRIKHGQGFQRAMRNLVEYSVLQLMGKLYNTPYWRILGSDHPDPDVERSIRVAFLRKTPANQVLEIQKLLRKIDLGEVKDSSSGSTYKKVPSGGDGRDRATQAFINAFVNKYTPKTPRNDLAGVYVKLREYSALQQFKMAVKDLDDRPEQDRTSPKKFFEQFHRAENVYQHDGFGVR